ncbi:MAG: selenide, water dikinase SelD [Deltaproteobacteria bacterium]|nr:MAG: selenide, water dikinase SelD [Deltaproteobacteria bacterium]
MQVLHELPKFNNPDMLVGTETSDDAGVFRLRPDLAIVNTVDFFTPIVDDPYVFGQIAATNSLSDVYAMGGEPKTAMNIVCFPKGKMEMEVLGEILKGGADKVKESGAVIIGGHSIIDEEIKYGMAITGVIHPDKIFRNVGVQEGDALILTKPLGTGIITTALKKGKASKESVDEAVAFMTTLNAAASAVMCKYPVHACSDVTGFGILGHALGMASGSGVTLVIESQKLPIMHRAPRLAEKGYITGGCKRNRDYLKDKITVEKSLPEGIVEVAFDPQTSGGLLIAVAKRLAAKLIEDLQAAGVTAATQVGYATSLQKPWVRLV